MLHIKAVVSRNIRSFVVVLVVLGIAKLRWGCLVTLVDSKWLLVESMSVMSTRKDTDTQTHRHTDEVVRRTSVLTVQEPPSSFILAWMAAMAFSSASTPCALSRALVVITYTGVASSLTLIGNSSVLHLRPSRRPSLMASIPWYVKHVTSRSARRRMACGVRRRLMFLTSSSLTTSDGHSMPSNTSSGVLSTSNTRGQVERVALAQRKREREMWRT